LIAARERTPNASQYKVFSETITCSSPTVLRDRRSSTNFVIEDCEAVM
jgi:hypothetical protein